MLKLISFLESATPLVQAFDFLLMLFCGFYCLRCRRGSRNGGLTILAAACFVSAVILIGFVLSTPPNNHALFPVPAATRNFFYLVARLLAPFELLLFAIAIILVARAIARAVAAQGSGCSPSGHGD